MKDLRYNFLEKPILSESLKDVVVRVIPFWDKDIIPALKSGKKIIIAASGNSIRAIIKHIDIVSEEEISNINIPVAVPLVYELNKNFKKIKSYYLGDSKKIKSLINISKNQGSIKK